MTAVAEFPTRASNGGLSARRAMVRWAWRLLRREWRQQLLILALITIAVCATVVGIGVSANTPMPANTGFGTAQDLATYYGTPAQLQADVAALRQHVHRLDVIENQTLTIPGTIETFELRSQKPSGPYGSPLLSLTQGRYPTGPGQVALTSTLASDFHAHVGGRWHEDGVSYRVVGIVDNPENTLDVFALVAPGQVPGPSEATVLFDAHGVLPKSIRSNVITPASITSSNVLNPETITIAVATLTLLLIGLVAIAGFTVLAQRRLRSIGVLESLGATDQNVRLVVRANGALVGLVGAVAGLVLGLIVWLAYRPSLEVDAHHAVGPFALPWVVIVVAMALAIVASYFAASRPAKAITKVSVVSALAGRPPATPASHRSAVPGIIAIVGAFFLLGSAGASGGHGSGMIELVLGFVALTVPIVLLAPFMLVALRRGARRGSITVRLALRDLARYRSRSGAALSAVSIAILVAAVVAIASAARFGNVWDYAGPNVASDQILIYTPNGPYGPGGPGNAQAGSGASAPTIATMTKDAKAIARSLDAQKVVQLESTSATIQNASPGRSYSGPLYVATPQLLQAFGINEKTLNPKADILSMRPGFASLAHMQIVYGNYFAPRKNSGSSSSKPWPCPKSDCLANPVVEQELSLPAGTSAPNTVITEYAVHQLGLSASVAGWLVQTAQPLSAAQIADTRSSAAAAGMGIETKSSIPTSASIIDWASIVGLLLALGILAMTVGLLRAERSSDLRVLSATGASGFERRTINAVSAGTLALLGAVVGTAGGYLAMIAFSRSNNLDGLSSLASVPVFNLLMILIALPLIASMGGWLFAGREPRAIDRRPIE